MTTVINCPSCQQGLQLPANLAGHEVQCPTCSRTFTAAGNRAPSPARHHEEHSEARPSFRPSPPSTPLPTPSPDRGERRERGPQKPGKVQALSIMMLVGGIYALVHALGAVAASGLACCIWPGVYYAMVLGILAIIKASPILGETGHLQPAPKSIAIMQIINIINLDVVNCVMGIINLVFLNEPEVRRYFRG